MQRFRYLHLCEEFNQQTDNCENDKIWTPVKILGQMLRRRNPDDIHIRLKILWLNGETSWIRLDDFQMDFPEMVLNYAQHHGLQRFSFFRWTQLYQEVRESECENPYDVNDPAVRAMLNVQYNPQGKYKFGVEVPFGVRHALRLDSINGNSLWKDAIAKELNEINHHKTFRRVSADDDLSTYKNIPYHIVFDVKYDGRRKARLVCGGNHTDPPKEDIYSGVVGIGTIHLAFQLAIMNGLQACAANVGTAFLYGKTKERVYITAGKEFGDLAGHDLIVDKGLYGLRSSAARFHEHLAERI